MSMIQASEIGGNLVAALDMIAYSEGTDFTPSSKSTQHGYDMLVGGGLFTSFEDHPHRLIHVNSHLNSTAAGRYQYLIKTWTSLADRLKLPDFSPRSQDLACLELFRECGAYQLFKAGRVVDGIAHAQHIWASLPGAGYGQHENTVTKLVTFFRKQGGTVVHAKGGDQ